MQIIKTVLRTSKEKNTKIDTWFLTIANPMHYLTHIGICTIIALMIDDYDYDQWFSGQEYTMRLICKDYS